MVGVARPSRRGYRKSASESSAEQGAFEPERLAIVPPVMTIAIAGAVITVAGAVAVRVIGKAASTLFVAAGAVLIEPAATPVIVATEAIVVVGEPLTPVLAAPKAIKAPRLVGAPSTVELSQPRRWWRTDAPAESAKLDCLKQERRFDGALRAD